MPLRLQPLQPYAKFFFKRLSPTRRESEARSATLLQRLGPSSLRDWIRCKTLFTISRGPWRARRPRIAGWGKCLLGEATRDACTETQSASDGSASKPRASD